LIFNLFIGIVISSVEEARQIELHRAERPLLDDDPSDEGPRRDLHQRLHALTSASKHSNANSRRSDAVGDPV